MNTLYSHIRKFRVIRPGFWLVLFTLLLNLYTPPGLHAKASGTAASVLLGIWPKGYVDQNLVTNQIVPLDTWTGKKHSLVGLSLDLEDNPQNLSNQLNALWDSGYTPFINLVFGFFSQPSAYQIAIGQKDTAIAQWAQAYGSWAAGGKQAFIAVLPEMNSPWRSYGGDAENFKFAYSHIRQIFADHGVPAGAVRWVFAPAGMPQYPFGDFFPGESTVDVVGFSVFHFGYCSINATPLWSTPQAIYKLYVSQLRNLAPTKPIFITQTATTAYASPGQSNPTAKNQWITDAYTYLANTLGIQAILYYNYPQNLPYDCDWQIYQPGGVHYDSYPAVVSNSAFGYLSPTELSHTDLDLVFQNHYLPITLSSAGSGNQKSILLGMYPEGWTGNQTTFETEVWAVDTWGGKRLSIVGTFLNIELANPTTSVTDHLNLIWNNGYTPFVNLETTRTAYQIASGQYDASLRGWANAYKTYALGGGGRMAFIAPLQEMNGYWVPYGQDPANFKLAYYRIQQIFTDQGVPDEAVRWVFAPNGWTVPAHNFEAYYPGDGYVDVVAFSAYNFGRHPSNPYPDWQNPSEVFSPFLARMTALAPIKPIFIAQTATTSHLQSGIENNVAKNAWLRDAYALLATYPSLRGIMYFNIWNDYDWPFYIPGDPAHQFQGYIDGVANPAFGFMFPEQLMDTDLSIQP